MIKKPLTIKHTNDLNAICGLWMNPDLKKQCVVAVRQDERYEFMECHFEVYHNGGNALMNTIYCVNTLGVLFSISDIYCDHEPGKHEIEDLFVCLFNPNDENDKKILSELSWEQYQEHMKYNIF